MAFHYDNNILGGSVRVWHKIKSEYSVLVNTEIGLEINAHKSNSGYQNAGRSDSIKNDNISFQILRQFK